MTFQEFFNRIETQYSALLPFVVYRKPRETTLYSVLQQTDNLFFVEDFTEKGFVFAPFDDTEPAVLLPSEFSERASVTYESSDLNVTNLAFETSEEKSIEIARVSSEEKNKNIVEESRYIKLIEKAIDTIKSYGFKKIVMSRKEDVTLSEASPLAIFKKLVHNYPLAFVYCWYHPKVGLWLGATPETLMHIEGKKFSMMALAGTQSYKGSLNINWGEKEYNEQKIVTDFIVNSLNPLAETISISKVETVKAGNLLHLKTIISAQLKLDTTLKTLIAIMHPTPAVCGLPKRAAKAFILNNEAYNRAFYSGFLGELNIETTKAPRAGKRNIENKAYSFISKNTQFYVNLRCMQLVDKTAILYVGGGITEASNPKNEWEETQAKAFVIKSCIY